MRKLVTIRHIRELLPIEGADLIELAKVDDWQCVVKKGEFEKGDYCIYFEIDSFLPIKPEFEFLRKSSYKKMGDQEGFRIRTAKFKGQVAQGLALPIRAVAPDAVINSLKNDTDAGMFTKDFSEAFGVVKYEQPIPAELAGNVKGSFPNFIKKTDQERCQNIGNAIFVDNEDSRYEITMKLDGTSFTAFYVDKEDGVCGRNWELKVDESNEHNTLVRMYVDSGLQEILRKYGKNIAVQGELMGPGIQKNRESLPAHKLFVFDIYDIDTGGYVAPHVRHEILQELYNLGLDKTKVEHVPVLAMAESLEDLGIFGVDGLLQFAEGPSIKHSIREGLVFKRIDGGFSFKAISNQFLLKSED